MTTRTRRQSLPLINSHSEGLPPRSLFSKGRRNIPSKRRANSLVGPRPVSGETGVADAKVGKGYPSPHAAAFVFERYKAVVQLRNGLALHRMRRVKQQEARASWLRVLHEFACAERYLIYRCHL